jgi:DNA-binding transcriptional LysR family regulator
LPDPVPDRLETWPLFSQAYHMAVGSRGAAASRSMQDLACETWIDCTDDGTLMWRKAAAEAGVDLQFRHRVDTPAMALRLIVQNLGMAILPSHLQADGVKLTALADHSLSLEVVLCAVAGRRRGRAADAFLRSARARDWQAASVQAGPVIAANAASTSAGSAR